MLSPQLATVSALIIPGTFALESNVLIGILFFNFDDWVVERPFGLFRLNGLKILSIVEALTVSSLLLISSGNLSGDLGGHYPPTKVLSKIRNPDHILLLAQVF